jgi:glucose-6-phosphate 1-dehydrogenase
MLSWPVPRTESLGCRVRRIELVFRTGHFFCGNGKAALYSLVKGDGGLFTGEDAVEAAWMVVDQVLEHRSTIRAFAHTSAARGARNRLP